MSPDETSPPSRHEPFVNGAGWRITHSSNPGTYAPGQVVRIEPDRGHEARFALVWTDPQGRSHRLCGLALQGRDRLRGIDGSGVYRVLVEQPAGAGRIFVKVGCSLGGSMSLPLSGIWGAEALAESAAGDAWSLPDTVQGLDGRPLLALLL
jgi:hypothetical protein